MKHTAQDKGQPSASLLWTRRSTSIRQHRLTCIRDQAEHHAVRYILLSHAELFQRLIGRMRGCVGTEKLLYRKSYWANGSEGELPTAEIARNGGSPAIKYGARLFTLIEMVTENELIHIEAIHVEIVKTWTIQRNVLNS